LFFRFTVSQVREFQDGRVDVQHASLQRVRPLENTAQNDAPQAIAWLHTSEAHASEGGGQGAGEAGRTALTQPFFALHCTQGQYTLGDP
jgi:hypothetical protein